MLSVLNLFTFYLFMLILTQTRGAEEIRYSFRHMDIKTIDITYKVWFQTFAGQTDVSLNTFSSAYLFEEERKRHGWSYNYKQANDTLKTFRCGPLDQFPEQKDLWIEYATVKLEFKPHIAYFSQVKCNNQRPRPPIYGCQNKICPGMSFRYAWQRDVGSSWYSGRKRWYSLTDIMFFITTDTIYHAPFSGIPYYSTSSEFTSMFGENLPLPKYMRLNCVMSNPRSTELTVKYIEIEHLESHVIYYVDSKIYCSKKRLTYSIMMKTKCKIGYRLDRLNIVCSICDKFYYGENCKEKCRFCLRGCSNDSPNCYDYKCVFAMSGASCNVRCDNGKFNPNNDTKCWKQCHCRNDAQCRGTDGFCENDACAASRYTKKEPDFCMATCPNGKYGKHCTEKCHCKNNGPCYSNGECDECDNDREGKRCEKRVCPRGNYKVSGFCTGVCRCLNTIKCFSANGTCESGPCKAGWKGVTCNNSCDGQHFGQNCKHSCRCIDNTACMKTDGQCPSGCHHRYTGRGCQRSCSNGKYFKEGKCLGICNCLNQSECHVVDGKCPITGCAPGYKLENQRCDKKCDHRRWGQSCGQICHCLNDTCHQVNGFCESGCDYRHTGPNCSETCAPGNYSYPACDKICHCNHDVFCRVTDGLCGGSGCVHGAAKTGCRDACDDRKWGDTCENKCGCKNNHVCDAVTCVCPSGCDTRLYGESCNKSCPSGSFLNKSDSKCGGHCRCKNPDSCHVYTGECTDGECQAGWRGPDSQVICQDGRYGDRCSKRCHCKDNELCNHETGLCRGEKCNARYFGSFCHETCDDHTFRVRVNGALKCSGVCHCRDNSECDVTTGECGEAGCAEGRVGQKCQKFCNKTFGDGCNKKCHCEKDARCDYKTGRCDGQCHHRYMGANCQNTCLDGKFGEQCDQSCRCFDIYSCHVVSGACANERCLTIRYGGPDCKLTCPNKLYMISEHCTGKCRCRKDGECDVMDGSCGPSGCQPGWKGSACRERCPGGKFGDSCSKTCHCKFGRVCNNEYGKCENNQCEDGWVGVNCQQRQEYSRQIETIGIFAGTVGCVLAIAFITGCIAMHRRRQRRRQFVAHLSMIRRSTITNASTMTIENSVINQSLTNKQNVDDMSVTESRGKTGTIESSETRNMNRTCENIASNLDNERITARGESRRSGNSETQEHDVVSEQGEVPSTRRRSSVSCRSRRSPFQQNLAQNDR